MTPAVKPQRVELRSDPPPAHDASCWHCGRAVSGPRVTRYLYPGDLQRTAIVEDWHACPCGAFQNVRRPTHITITTLERS